MNMGMTTGSGAPPQVEHPFHGEALARDQWAERYGPRIIFGFIGLFAICLLLLNFAGQVPGQSFSLKVLSDVAQTAGQWIGFFFCLRMALRLRHASEQLQQQLAVARERNQVLELRAEVRAAKRAWLAWLCLSLGIACYGLAGIVWTSYDARMPTAQVPYPGLYDIGYVAAYPFFLVGTILLARRSRSTAGRARLLIDAFAVIGTALSLSWFFLLGPSIAGLTQQPGVLAEFLALYFPAGDLLLIMVSVLLLFGPLSTRAQEPVLIRLTLGLCCLATADSILGALNLTSGFNSGTLLDLLWPLSLLLVGWAAIEYPKSVAREQEQTARVAQTTMSTSRLSSLSSTIQTIIPFMLVLLTCAILLTVIAPRGKGVLIQADVVALLLVLIVVVRQALTLLENNRLTMQMRGELVISRRELQGARKGADVAAHLAERTHVLNEAIQHLKEAQAQVAQGNFTVRVPPLTGEVAPLGVSFNLMVDRLKDLAQQVTISHQMLQEQEMLQRLLERLATGTLNIAVDEYASRSRTGVRVLFLAVAQVQRAQVNQVRRLHEAVRLMQSSLARGRQVLEDLETRSPLNASTASLERTAIDGVIRSLQRAEQHLDDLLPSWQGAAVEAALPSPQISEERVQHATRPFSDEWPSYTRQDQPNVASSFPEVQQHASPFSSPSSRRKAYIPPSERSKPTDW